MKTIPAGEFKAKCLALIKHVHQSHENIVVTRHGKPVAKLVPFTTETSLEKPLKNAAIYIGDIVSPVDEEWEAEK